MEHAQAKKGALCGIALHEIICRDTDNSPCNYRFLEIDSVTQKLLGRAATDLIGRTALEVFPNIDPAIIQLVGQVALTGKPNRFEFFSHTSLKHLDVFAYSPQNGQFTTVMSDITESKEIEERLMLAQCTLDSCGDAVYWMDETGHFVYVNKSACETTGYSEDELLEMSVHDLNPNFPKNAWAPQWERLKKQRFFSTESIHQGKSSGSYPVSVMASMIDVNEKAFICAVARDISSLKKSEQERQNKERLKATATLAGGIAHDFNNLMTGVLGSAELLSETLEGDPYTEKLLHNIIHSAGRAGVLAQQMLAFTGKSRRHPIQFSLNDIIRDCLKSSECVFTRRYIETDLYERLMDVEADRVQIGQVILGLLTNAHEATNDRGVIRITTSNEHFDSETDFTPNTLKAGTYVRMRVEDDGEGMTEDVIKKVFDPFFTTKFPGRGLGMSAAHGIVSAHEGAIIIDSTEGIGSRFDIYLPGIPPKPLSTAAPRMAHAAGNPPATVLVVDDEPIVQDVTRQLLERHDFRVLTANDGAEAISTVKTFDGEIHAVILDLEMPAMRGGEALPILRRLKPNMGIVVCSGHKINAMTDTLVDSGADAFLQKPFRFQKLVSILRQVIHNPPSQ